jgi:hypothetical protein
MPSGGAATLRDLAARDSKLHITVVCEHCSREGRYSVSRLLETAGDMRLPDLLAHITKDCAKHQNVAIHDRCRAIYRW